MAWALQARAGPRQKGSSSRPKHMPICPHYSFPSPKLGLRRPPGAPRLGSTNHMRTSPTATDVWKAQMYGKDESRFLTWAEVFSRDWLVSAANKMVSIPCGTFSSKAFLLFWLNFFFWCMHMGGKCQTNMKGNVEVGIHHFTFLPPYHVGAFQFLPILANTGYSLTDYGHPRACEVVVNCSSASLITSDVEHYFMHLLVICIFFLECLSDPLHILKLGYLYFIVEL